MTSAGGTPRSGTVVVREGRIAVASEGAAALLGRTLGELEGRLFPELFAPEERERIVDRYARRMRGEPVPSDYEAVVLRADGSRATFELHVDREGRDVVVHYRDLSLDMARRARLLELAALGAAIQRERTEQEVLDRVRSALPPLGVTPMLLRPLTEGVKVEWSGVPEAMQREFARLMGRPLVGFVGSWSPFARRVWTEGAAFSDDWSAEMSAFVPAAHAARARELAARFQVQRTVAVRVDERGGPRFYLTLVAGWLRAEDVAAVRLFAAQVAAALDAAAAIADLSRRVHDLSAVHALTVRTFASPPGDVHALLHEGCQEVAAALGGAGAAVLLVEESGKVLRGVALVGADLDPARLRFPIERDGLAAEIFRTGEPAFSLDVTRDPRSLMFGRPIPSPAMLGVPLGSRRAVRGLLFVAAEAGRTFTDAERALATALAGQLAMGLENAELHAAAQAQVHHLSLLAEMGRTLASTLDLDRVLQAGAEAARKLLDTDRAFVILYDPAASALRVGAGAGRDVERLRDEYRPSLDRSGITARALRERRLVVVEDLEADPDAHPFHREMGSRSVVVAPLLLRGEPLGVLTADSSRRRRFTEAEQERASAVAHQLAVAIENARLYEDLRRSYQQLAHAQRQLIEQERLAALGELSAAVAHEVRNPLAVIFNSLASLRRLLHPEGEARVLLDIVGEEADRLNRIVGDLLDFARPVTPVLRPEPLERVVDEAVVAALGDGAPGVSVDRAVSPDLPRVPMDARLVRQAVLNVAANAVQAMPRGGRLGVGIRRDGDGVLLEITDTGPGIPDEIRTRIFEPFFTTKATGTGLGLAVVKRIVEGHRGEVEVSAGPGGGTTVRLRFPVAPRPPGAVESGDGMG